MGKKWVALLLLAASLLLCACEAKQENTPTQLPEQPPVETTLPVVQQPTVGICLPSGSAYWKSQGLFLSQRLEDIGYDTIVEYAAGDPKVQQNQMLELIARQVDCVVIAAADGYGLREGLSQAKSAQIPVVAYDRMLMYTDAVTFCVQPDSYAMGQQLAQYMIEKQMPDPKKPKNIEFLMGAPDNDSSLQFYRGVMDVLKPLLDSGALVCRSGRTGFEDISIPGESIQTALEQCHEYMREYYEKRKPDIFLCATDTLAQGCAYALESFKDQLGKYYPAIVSVGGTSEAVARVSAGLQSATVYTDMGNMAQQCATLVHRLLQDKELPATETRSNGTVQIPCYFQEATVVDMSNYQQLLLNTGVYTQTQLDEALLERTEVTLPVATRPGTLPPPPTKAPTAPTEATPSIAPTEATIPTETIPAATEPTETTAPAIVPTEAISPTTPPATPEQ